MVIDKHIRRSLENSRAVLHEALRVINDWVHDFVRVAPSPVEVFIGQAVSIAATTTTKIFYVN